MSGRQKIDKMPLWKLTDNGLVGNLAIDYSDSVDNS